MLGRPSRRRTSRWLIAAMLFAQAAYAFAGCETAMPSAAEAVAQAGMTCHEPQQSANLCVNHCLASDQSLDKPTLSVPAVSVAPALVAAIPAFRPIERAISAALPAPATGPPVRILFRSLLI